MIRMNKNIANVQSIIVIVDRYFQLKSKNK
jgi:hypothetical protein